MNLLPSIQIDAHAPWVEQHNREIREVWDTFNADKPIRVPFIFTGARTLYLEEHGIDYRRYYDDPDEMIRLQLAWQWYARELPIGDSPLAEVPESWNVFVDFHPVASAVSLGCPVLFRPNAVPAHECAHLSREQCLEMEMPDMFISGLLPRHTAFTEHFDHRCAEGLTFMGKPVMRRKPTLPSTGGGTFSTALDIRGPEIMVDMYEDPAFVHQFLLQIAEWQIDLHRAWYRREGMDYWMDVPGEGEIALTDHGIDMLSPELYDRFLASLILKLCKKYDKRPGTYLHHCGHGTHLFPLINERFGLTTIHALTWPLNDIARVRRQFGDDVYIVAVIADAILATTPAEIQKAVKDFLTPEVKGQGRLSIWAPGEVFGIPAENYRALYEAIKEFGCY